MSKTYFVYILLCENGSMYTGITNDLNKRMREHVELKSASKFTRSFKPKKLIACWKIDGGRGQALKVESYIKKLNSTQKKNYVQNLSLLSLDCEKDLAITSVPLSIDDIEQVNINLFS